MNLRVPDEIGKKTTQCHCGFCCQDSQGWAPCGKIMRQIGSVLELSADAAEGLSCQYRTNFGGGKYCMCPTRVEIFKRHGV